MCSRPMAAMSATGKRSRPQSGAARGAGGVLDEVPVALPALTRAVKLGKRAATVGFDWPDASGPRAKLLEELAEVDAAQRGEGESSLEDEVGDLLLAATSLARHLGVDPETACVAPTGASRPASAPWRRWLRPAALLCWRSTPRAWTGSGKM